MAIGNCGPYRHTLHNRMCVCIVSELPLSLGAAHSHCSVASRKSACQSMEACPSVSPPTRRHYHWHGVTPAPTLLHSSQTSHSLKRLPPDTRSESVITCRQRNPQGLLPPHLVKTAFQLLSDSAIAQCGDEHGCCCCFSAGVRGRRTRRMLRKRWKSEPSGQFIL